MNQRDLEGLVALLVALNLMGEMTIEEKASLALGKTNFINTRAINIKCFEVLTFGWTGPQRA